MRLGKQASILSSGKILTLYKNAKRVSKGNIVHERFRHRFEVHPEHAKKLKSTDLKISGISQKE